MGRARKKPVVIEYVTFEELYDMAQKEDATIDCKELNFNGHTIMWYDKLYNQENVFSIYTLEGKMIMTNKDVLIIGIQGELYPCKIDIFNDTYDKLDK